MRNRFGRNVWKVSVDAGFSCPNIDGTVGQGGCLFCNTSSFAPARRAGQGMRQAGSPGIKSVREQIDEGIRQLRRRYVKAEKFIAYFQPSTNTHAPRSVLETCYREALEQGNIVGLAIGTRPDALPEPVLDLLETLSVETDLQLEIGLQSIHRKSLDFLRRGHDYATFLDAFRRSRARGLRLGVHLILGLPHEDRSDLLETADQIARLRPESVKLHNLYVARGTGLADLWHRGGLRLPTLQEYAQAVVDFLERIPAEIVVERISGEATDEYLLAPDWSGRKHAARNAIDQEFRRRNSWQGKKIASRAD